VPWWPLWPWYRRAGERIRIGKWKLPWKAHRIDSYRQQGYNIP
jgi:hypothetical protein